MPRLLVLRRRSSHPEAVARPATTRSMTVASRMTVQTAHVLLPTCRVHRGATRLTWREHPHPRKAGVGTVDLRFPAIDAPMGTSTHSQRFISCSPGPLAYYRVGRLAATRRRVATKLPGQSAGREPTPRKPEVSGQRRVDSPPKPRSVGVPPAGIVAPDHLLGTSSARMNVTYRKYHQSERAGRGPSDPPGCFFREWTPSHRDGIPEPVQGAAGGLTDQERCGSRCCPGGPPAG